MFCALTIVVSVVFVIMVVNEGKFRQASWHQSRQLAGDELIRVNTVRYYSVYIYMTSFAYTERNDKPSNVFLTKFLGVCGNVVTLSV